VTCWCVFGDPPNPWLRERLVERTVADSQSPPVFSLLFDARSLSISVVTDPSNGF
jgi:hypothetical protein